jgi:hypothetical protein
VSWFDLKHWVVLREMVLNGVLSVISVLMLAIFERSGVLSFLLPSPEKTGEEFMRALCLHRYTSAWNLLSALTRKLVTLADLARIAHALERRCGGIAAIDAIDSRESAENASARLVVTTFDGERCVLYLPLRRENALWTVANVNPLFTTEAVPVLAAARALQGSVR